MQLLSIRNARRWPSAIYQTIRRGQGSAIDLMFPEGCAFCDGEIEVGPDSAALCRTCLEQLTTETGVICRRCGMPVEENVRLDRPCPHCHNQTLTFDRAFALGPYRTALRQSVLLMKGVAGQPLAAALGHLLADRISGTTADGQTDDDRLDLVVPMPMHWWRRLRRGVNCPETLATVLAGRLHLPMRRDVLRRTRNTKVQHKLPSSQRRANLSGALGLSAGYDLSEAHVLLVDDTMTTGATANAATRVLRRAGANRVSLAVVARGIGAG